MKLLETQAEKHGLRSHPSGDKEELAAANHPCLNARQDNDL